MKVIIAIPARYASTRFEGKVLAKQTGKYLLEHTWEKARKSALAEKIIVATDDRRVVQACEQFGAETVMTSPDHQSGTDRIAEAVKDIEGDIIINVQADEPELDPRSIDMTAELLIENGWADMSTLLTRFENAEQVSNPNIVKCVRAQYGTAR